MSKFCVNRIMDKEKIIKDISEYIRFKESIVGGIVGSIFNTLQLTLVPSLSQQYGEGVIRNFLTEIYTKLVKEVEKNDVIEKAEKILFDKLDFWSEEDLNKLLEIYKSELMKKGGETLQEIFATPIEELLDNEASQKFNEKISEIIAGTCDDFFYVGESLDDSLRNL